ncbi:A1S_2505 family phage non-structural protein [Variovorax sp. RA8]|uniref:A1S_2505 family phage non-structural protein n=1 Tax=Variovorax sp. (strain JCM 16519 / RA8) TaxID=662548 RepID=UPI000A928EFC
MAPVFVFGSNTHGRHGKGAALFARQQRGAIYGQGEGLQGNSYAIPTKGQRQDRVLFTLPLEQIRAGVDRFLAFAASRPELQFEVTPIGCGHAGYRPAEIAPMFENAPANCQLPDEFLAYIPGLAGRVNVPAIRFPSRAGRKGGNVASGGVQAPNADERRAGSAGHAFTQER